MKYVKGAYKWVRSIVFSVVMVAVSLYVLLYIAISLPFVQEYIKNIGERELSRLFGNHVTIGAAWISPGGEITLEDVDFPAPDGKECVRIRRLGAGIDLTQLVFNRAIVISYGEIIGLEGHLRQEHQSDPWNIQFIIDALQPKDKTKPPTLFDLKLRNIVIRSSSISMDKEWQPRKAKNIFDANHLQINDLQADVSLPRIKNDDFTIDLRRLSLSMGCGLVLKKITAFVHLTPAQLSISKLSVELPGTLITPGDISMKYKGYQDIVPNLKSRRYVLHLDHTKITPSDFNCFLPMLRDYTSPLFLTLDASGSIEHITLDHLLLIGIDYGLTVDLAGEVHHTTSPRDRQIKLRKLHLDASASAIDRALSLAVGMPEKTKAMIGRLMGCVADISGTYGHNELDFKGLIDTGIGSLTAEAAMTFVNHGLEISGQISTPGFMLGKLLNNDMVGNLNFSLNADAVIAGKDINGRAELDLREAVVRGESIHNLKANVSKSGNDVSGEISIEDTFAAMRLSGNAVLAGKDSRLDITTDIMRLNPHATGLLAKGAGYTMSGLIHAQVSGLDPATLTGDVEMSNIDLTTPRGPIYIGDMSIGIHPIEDVTGRSRHVFLRSAFADADIEGVFDAAHLPKTVTAMLGKTVPVLADKFGETTLYANDNIDFKILIKNNETLTDYLNLPVRLLTDADVRGYVHGNDGNAFLRVEAPYLQQGKDKLVRNTALQLVLNSQNHTSGFQAQTKLPGKDDTEVDVKIDVRSQDNNMLAKAMWNLNRAKDYSGEVGMSLNAVRDNEGSSSFVIELLPSQFQVADTVWHIGAGTVAYNDQAVHVDGLKVWHRDQYVEVDGTASTNPDDKIVVDMRDIDLDYVFETLNINYVTFGGRATGSAVASNLFDFRRMDAHTENLKVKGLTYNGALLGDADLSGTFDPTQMKVGIGAEISDRGRHCASISGGVWVTRDSLAFDMNTDKVNIRFLQPFVQAFSSDINGLASGHVKLFGTFSDIDLTGRVFADTLTMKVDYTNVYYSGSDSVYMAPGRIVIPSFRIYDKSGHSAMLTGEVRHRYFHDPTFDFKVSDAHNLLCYNTDAKINPDWYGVIYGNGGGTITGYPGYVGIMVDMNIAPRSVFNFVLNDTEAAASYEFLTFSDNRARLREEEELRAREAADTVPDFVKLFRKKRKAEVEESRPSVFNLDLRATVHPDAEMILVMDPVAGDKIKAHGSGSIQLGYSSDSDEMTMYGKYTLADGQYNFTLQDLILKDFTIREGSNISFNGDPLKALLDITAIYRVNTNLADLDKSFSSDRELNRTNVPVDAVLSVSGDLQSPDITFDIELPTLTQDVARKVKSIISTDDMMNRQIIYLLALNRFYTPEYMGGSSNGGEWASMASATVTSQLANMLSQLTDKFTLAPSLRTDKGDFSDMEVDVALSSRLLNNRLLLNGNFGYRDRTTSNTTFIGDFDIEYLLNRSGNLRLKAYNHYNDQNYYLKSALTTQGLGVVYRKDFDNLFHFIKRMRKQKHMIPDSVHNHK